jgi:hypothetical protein
MVMSISLNMMKAGGRPTEAGPDAQQLNADDLGAGAADVEQAGARVPQAPQTPWTEMAPTGSSILILSKKTTE